MLLSESANQWLRRNRRRLRVTEPMLTLSCERCGRSFPADAASISREQRSVVYRCPGDGEDVPFAEFMNERLFR